MRVRATICLLLLFIGSLFSNGRIAQGQTINKFPYRMTQEGWKLGDNFEWWVYGGFDYKCGFMSRKPGLDGDEPQNSVLSPLFDFSTLKNPEITLTGEWFILYELDGNGTVLQERTQQIESKVTYPLKAQTKQLKFTSVKGGTLSAGEIVIGEAGKTSNAGAPDDYQWTETNGTYTLSSTGYESIGQKATYQLPTFYFYEFTDQYIYLTVQNLNTTNDEISLIIGGQKRVLTKDGDLKIEMLYVTYGATEVYLQAIHKQGIASNVTISNFTTPICYAPVTSASNIYDIDGDGKMEFLAITDIHDSYEYAWEDYLFSKYTFPGLTPIPDKKIPSAVDCSTARLCNLNNDATPDIRYLKGGKVAIGNSTSWDLIPNISAPYPCDYNNDGKPDLMESQRFIYRQSENGTFSRTEIIPISSEEDESAYNRWNSNIHSSTMGLGNLGGDVGVPIGDNTNNHKVASFSSGREYYSLDFNKDGYEDLIDEQTGAILLNRGNNRFLYAPQEGKLYPRDLNGDYITDYVVYDADTKKVSTIVFNKDGSSKKQTLMTNLTMDEDIYFYDFDRDGDVDILLPFSNSSGLGEYSYLVLCINDGKGNFKIDENNTYRKKWYFIACADFNNDGYYDVLAMEKDPNDDTTGYIYCLNGTNKLRFTEPATSFWQVPAPATHRMKDMKTIIGDFDEDGIYDILLHQIEYNYGSPGKSLFFRFNDIATTSNKAPEKLKAPTIVSDPAVGMLKINWTLGKDDKSSPCDLTYALRIGSEPGKGDIFYANADENGKRLNILPGNMGYNLDKILNVSGWKKGNYYIAVQAIDPMGKGSEWSEETVYKHEIVNAAIFLSAKSMTTGDVLTVAYDGVTDPTYTYTWDLNGGEILEANAENSHLQVVFNAQGQKTISLQVTDAEGNVSTPITDDVYVYPTRFDDKGSAFSDPNSPYIMSISDTNNDGIYEFITSDGVYNRNAENKYEKSSGIFNTNLKIGRYLAPIDYNKDGLIDYLGTINEETGILLNLGNNRFEVQKKDISNQLLSSVLDVSIILKTSADFNNDGYPDYLSINEYYKSKLDLNINSGNGTFSSITICESLPETYISILGILDINNDNLPDILVDVYDETYKEGNQTYHIRHRKILLNKGNSEFEQVKSPIDGLDRFIAYHAVDLNNDGIKDLVCYKSENGYADYYHTYIFFSQNGEISYPEEPIELPNIAGYPYHPVSISFTDIDNNGYLDIVSTNIDRILYMYPDEKYELYTYETNRDDNEGSWGLNSHPQGIYYPMDFDGDNKPDYIGQYNGLFIAGNTRLPNTAPETPQNLRAIQDEEGFITVEWDPAKDAETPFTQMRYNLSVKKQGATGEGAFIVSPLNGLSNDAKPIPSVYEYLRGTQYRIPVSVVPVGKYEVQIQSIDNWNVSSNFSEPFVLEVTPKPLLSLPKEICQNKSVIVRYNGTITNDIQIDWGDANVLQKNDDGSYEVVWFTSGIKTLKVTSEGVTTPISFLVKAPIDASFTLPSVTLADVETNFTISDDIFLSNRTFEFSVATAENTDKYYEPAHFGIRFERKKNTKEVKAVFSKAGNYFVRLSVVDSGCGGVTETKSVTVKEAFAKPQISLISVDKETGKNQINWQFKNLPDYVTKVMIYKESSYYNQFNLIGEAEPSANYFIDMTSNPTVTTSRYQIRLNTSFGIETEPGSAHQSVHLTINKGMGRGWNLMWSKYEGATIDNYRILRGTSVDNMSEIASLSGNACSYSDLNAPEGLLYYTIEYSAYYEDEWEPMSAMQRAASRSAILVKAGSNVVNVTNAQNVTFVEELYIRHLEEEAELSDAQPVLHLYADVYPVTAAYKNVNWTITEGSELAYITNKGLLVANSAKGGSITVHATAIDGSDVSAELTITMSGITGEISTKEESNELIVYPSPVTDRLFIKGIPLHENRAMISIFSVNGQNMLLKEVRSEEEEISCSHYPTGIYILRVVTGDKVLSQRFMKK